METKTCFKCGITKDIESFYKHSRMADGRLGKCKDCARSDVVRNRNAKLEYYRKYDRDRANHQVRVEARQKYNNSEDGRLSSKKSHREWDKRNKHKKQANNKLRWALKSGLLTQKPCEICGSVKSQAHHDDYDKPLDVRWLCSIHHAEHHRKQRDKLREQGMIYWAAHRAS